MLLMCARHLLIMRSAQAHRWDPSGSSQISNPVLRVAHKEAHMPADFAFYHILLLFQRDARLGPFCEVLQDWV